MKIGLTGLAKSGKTTIFNALTRSTVAVGAYTNTTAEPNQAVIDVPDERLEKLTGLYIPHKTTPATIELVDFPGDMDSDSGAGYLFEKTIRELKSMDAIGVVLRNYEDALAGHPKPFDDLDTIISDLLISDLMIVEKRLEKIAWYYQRGQKSPNLANEEQLLKKIHDQLDLNEPLDKLDLDSTEKKLVKGFQFLTLKPMLIILNSDKQRFTEERKLPESIPGNYRLIELAGKFEMELAQFDDPDEIQLFMNDIGIKYSARDRLTRSAYEILGYISFFTVGEDEVRAWNIKQDSTAAIAAGAIHTDLARGFIRAECFHYQDLIKFGSEKTVRQNGKFRLEGKDYLVKDGDILSIRFNV